jgi:prolyl-tRNA synthetase
MLFSKYFIPTLREVKEESVSFNLSLRAGLISSLAAGMYSYLPLGLRVLRNIEKIIRTNMQACGAHEVLLPALQPVDLWRKTQRDELLGQVMLRCKDRKKRDLCLAPTHEEAVTDLVSKFVSSYRQLPLVLFQIQTKFRDELRPRSGLIRSCEFVMKDAYSFDRNPQGLDSNYQQMLSVYKNIFSECGLQTIPFTADTGFIGGSSSHEFLAEGSSGEDIFKSCQECGIEFKEGSLCPVCKSSKVKEKKALELGHIFKLGTKYSEQLAAFFLDEDSRRKPIIMGCYGIGVSRIISAVIEQNHDQDGIIWPEEIAPFSLEIVCLNPQDEEIKAFSFSLYEALNKEYEVLLDERDESAGVKFKDAYLLGMPYIVVVGKKNFSQDKIEIVIRKNKEKIVVSKADFQERLYSIIKGKKEY